MKCIADPAPPPPSSGPNVGAIAGGVVGGVALVALVVFMIWRFYIKKKREQQDQELEEEWENDEISSQKRTQQFNAMHDAASTRTRSSLANSILSRASNIIQIAYIPGVTNRNGSGRNSILAPVPPIPAAHRQTPPKSPLSQEGDALFFGIGDLRDSTYSGASSIASRNRDTRYSSNRDTRYTMQSITPSLARDSVASDVHWDDATAQPMPATAARVAPRMVSVKSSQSGSATATPESKSSPGTPPELASDRLHPVQVMVPGEGPSPSSSLRMKATQVTVGGGKAKGRFPVRQVSDASTAASSKHAPNVSSPLVEQDEEADVSDSEPQATGAALPLMKAIDFASPDSQPTESPFFDATELPSAAIAAASSTRPNPYASMASTIGMDERSRRGKSVGGLSAVIEEATKRASREPSHEGLGGKRDVSPFSDVHKLDEDE